MLVESEFENVTRGEQTWRVCDSGQGRAVLMFHGFPDLPHSYASIAASLNAAGYRTVLPYLRGYHADTVVPGRSYDAVHLAEDAIGLLDALELESAVLVGHDWGASIVWGAAALAPHRVDAIVPIGIPHTSTLKPNSVLKAVGALFFARHFVFFKLPWADSVTRRDDFKYIDTLYRRWAPRWKGPERDASVARVKEAMRDPRVLRGSIDYYRALSTDIDPRLMGSIRTSGLMVTGANDFGGHLGPYKRSLELLEGPSDVLVVPKAGHWPHRENESMFVEHLVAFLDELS